MNLSSNFQLLVIDDDPLVIEALQVMLPKNWSLLTKPSFQQAHGLFFHAAFVDLHLKGNIQRAEGLQEIQKIFEHNNKIEIIAISGNLSMELMEKCLTSGASKFLAKPLLQDEVLSTLEKIEALWALRETETRGGKRQQVWIGNSDASESIKKSIAKLKGEDGPILIEGETGTGKEVVCKILNQQEANRPFVMVNIAAIPENLFESELFGHVKGAFTGAEQMKVGLCEAAHGGDLFLDEIEALPFNQQVKLLRFLESGEVRKVGSKEPLHVQARVIAASNQNLAKLVQDGKFREDLYFRISGKKISLPKLVDRKADIPFLAKFFLSLLKPRTNKIFAPEAIELLQSYSWPGNVRELKRICEQVALTSPLPIIRSEDLQPLLQMTKQNSLNDSLGLTQLVENFEAEVIQKLLKNEKDIEKIAERLQISRSSLYKKIKDYNLQEET